MRNSPSSGPWDSGTVSETRPCPGSGKSSSGGWITGSFPESCADGQESSLLFQSESARAKPLGVKQ